MTVFEMFFWLFIFPVVEYLGWQEFKQVRAERKRLELSHERMEKL